MFYNFAFVNKMTKLDTSCKKHMLHYDESVFQDAEASMSLKRNIFREIVSG